jgi:hypothetical protein
MTSVKAIQQLPSKIKVRINQESRADMLLEVVIPTADQDSNCIGYRNLYDDTETDCIEYDPMNSALAPRNATGECNPVVLGKQQIPTKQYHPLVKSPLTSICTDTAKTANRFTDAQRHRTLRHHRLPQPTPSQERAHLVKLKRNDTCRMSSSFCSMLTLPEEESDQEEVMHLDLKQMQQSIESDARTSTRKASITSIGSDEGSCNKLSTHSSSSDRSLTSIDGDALSEASPTTTMFVPGQVSTKDVISKNLSAASDANLVAAFNPSAPYCQPCEMEHHSSSHRFVVCADTQFGITKNNESWQAEMEYSVGAVNLINAMEPRPAFVCVCGDLGEISMQSIY